MLIYQRGYPARLSSLSVSVNSSGVRVHVGWCYDSTETVRVWMGVRAEQEVGVVYLVICLLPGETVLAAVCTHKALTNRTVCCARVVRVVDLG
jgi:hypothetical protein